MCGGGGGASWLHFGQQCLKPTRATGVLLDDSDLIECDRALAALNGVHDTGKFRSKGFCFIKPVSRAMEGKGDMGGCGRRVGKQRQGSVGEFPDRRVAERPEVDNTDEENRASCEKPVGLHQSELPGPWQQGLDCVAGRLKSFDDEMVDPVHGLRVLQHQDIDVGFEGVAVGYLDIHLVTRLVT
jgi:hypothetical protein